MVSRQLYLHLRAAGYSPFAAFLLTCTFPEVALYAAALGWLAGQLAVFLVTMTVQL